MVKDKTGGELTGIKIKSLDEVRLKARDSVSHSEQVTAPSLAVSYEATLTWGCAKVQERRKYPTV